MTNKIIGLSILNGQIFIGKVKYETDSYYELSDTLLIFMNPQTGQLGLTNIPLATSTKSGSEIKIYKSGLYEFEPEQGIVNEYNQVTSTIQIAPAGTISNINSRKKP